MDLDRNPRAEPPSISPISGKKRPRSPSSSPSSEVGSKRQALSVDCALTPGSNTPNSSTNNPLTQQSSEPVSSKANWCCPNCGRSCWLCTVSPAAPPEQPELEDEEECARMASNDATSTTNTSNTVNSSKKLKRKKDHYASCGIKFVGPRDQGFKDHILDPLGVKWAKSFQLNGKPPQFLRSQPLPQSKVIIGVDDTRLERLPMNFKVYKVRRYDEHTLSTLCWDSIILRDDWVENPLVDAGVFKEEEEPAVLDEEPIKISVRRDKWKPQKQGPWMPEGSKFVYDWELEPDTSYAVSINMFDFEYRNKLHSDALQPWVAEKDVTVCPYLTVEYKCADKGGKEAQATNQAIAAAVLWPLPEKESPEYHRQAL